MVEFAKRNSKSGHKGVARFSDFCYYQIEILFILPEGCVGLLKLSLGPSFGLFFGREFFHQFEGPTRLGNRDHMTGVPVNKIH